MKLTHNVGGIFLSLAFLLTASSFAAVMSEIHGNILLTEQQSAAVENALSTTTSAPLTISIPSGDLVVGQQYTITWTGTPATSTGRISIYNQGYDYSDLTNAYPKGYDLSKGTFTFTLWSKLATKGGYYFQIGTTPLEGVSAKFTAVAPSAPSAPSNVTAKGGNGQAVVSFSAPSSIGGSAVTGYTVTGGGTDQNAGSESLTHMITGLTNGTSYTFTVVATNSIGSSAGALSNMVIPTAPVVVASVPSLTITAPATTNLVQGQSYTFTWTGQGNATGVYPAHIMIQGYDVSDIGNISIASGSYTYKVWSGIYPRTGYYFQIGGSSQILGVSSHFNIIAPAITVTSTTTTITATSTTVTTTTTKPTTPVVTSTSTSVTSTIGTKTGSTVTTGTAGVVAIKANDFLNSLGINVHFGNSGEASLEAKFAYTGIRNARDYLSSYTSFIKLHDAVGVKADAIAIAPSTTTVAMAPYLLTRAEALANDGALLTLEQPNEPNNEPFTYNNLKAGSTGDWAPVANFEKDFYTAVKSDSLIKNYPVLSGTLNGAETSNVGLQYLTIPVGATSTLPAGTTFADYINLHNYPQGNCGYGLKDNMVWFAASTTLPGANNFACWDQVKGEFMGTWNKHYPGYTAAQIALLPKVTTETGYETVTATKLPGGTILTQDQQGKLLVNDYLSQFKAGFKYTFLYDMNDNEGGDYNSWGIYGHYLNGNAGPKLAATYIHNFTTILADKSSAFTPGTVNYSIANEPATVHDMLMQKSTGVYDLAVWGERVAGTGSDNITVNLGATYKTVSVYDVTIGTSPIKTYSNVSAIPLTVSDHAMIVEVSSK